MRFNQNINLKIPNFFKRVITAFSNFNYESKLINPFGFCVVKCIRKKPQLFKNRYKASGASENREVFYDFSKVKVGDTLIKCNDVIVGCWGCKIKIINHLVVELCKI